MKKIAFVVIIVNLALSGFSQNVGQEGDTLINYVDINGLKQGAWKKSYEDGTPRFEAYFIDDKPVGKLTRWDSYGNLYAILDYDSAGSFATAIFFHKNGKTAATGYYLGKAKDSIWLYYDDNSRLYLQESYDNGKKDGLFITYTTQGYKLEELSWKQDVKNGIWKKYYAEGPLMWESTYINGKLEGEAKSYYKNGNLQKEGKFINDLMEGGWLKYNEDGSFFKVYQYKNGSCPEVEAENEAETRQLLENKDQIEGPSNSNDLDWLRNTGR